MNTTILTDTPSTVQRDLFGEQRTPTNPEAEAAVVAIIRESDRLLALFWRCGDGWTKQYIGNTLEHLSRDLAAAIQDCDPGWQARAAAALEKASAS
jgi:uncharacterized protein (DUF4415 family)